METLGVSLTVFDDELAFVPSAISSKLPCWKAVLVSSPKRFRLKTFFRFFKQVFCFLTGELIWAVDLASLFRRQAFYNQSLLVYYYRCRFKIVALFPCDMFVKVNRFEREVEGERKPASKVCIWLNLVYENLLLRPCQPCFFFQLLSYFCILFSNSSNDLNLQ